MVRFVPPSLPPILDPYPITDEQWTKIENEVPREIPMFHRGFVAKSCARFVHEFEMEKDQVPYEDVEHRLKRFKSAVDQLYEEFGKFIGQLDNKAASDACSMINIRLGKQSIFDYPGKLEKFREAVNAAVADVQDYKSGGPGRDKLVSDHMDSFIWDLGSYFQDLGGNVTARVNKKKGEYDGPFVRFVFAVMNLLPGAMQFKDKNTLGARIERVVKPRGMNQIKYYDLKN